MLLIDAINDLRRLSKDLNMLMLDYEDAKSIIELSCCVVQSITPEHNTNTVKDKLL